MSVDTMNREAINRHYGASRLVERIEAALEGVGADPERLTREDVARLEEFHIGGREATRELAELAGFGPGEQVLDLGAGLGGPARSLAAEYDCRVVALELTSEFCRAARWLNERLGLSELVEVREGDVLSPPFPDGSFDGIVLEHVGMNIGDKPRLFAECHRLLRPGGRMALYEICRGDGGEVVFPVPWAEEPSLSHLSAPEVLLSLAEEAGFRPEVWEDITEQATERLRGMLADTADLPPDAPPPVGLNLVLGESTALKGGNLMRSLSEGRVRVVRGVLRT